MDAFNSEISSRKQAFKDRFNIRSKNLKLDAKAQKYINWLVSSDKLSPVEKQNIEWLKENGVIEL